MPLASDPTGGRVSIIVMQNSLNIHSTGIHALGIFSSIKFCIQRGQDEISLTILSFDLSIGWLGLCVRMNNVSSTTSACRRTRTGSKEQLGSLQISYHSPMGGEGVKAISPFKNI